MTLRVDSNDSRVNSTPELSKSSQKSESTNLASHHMTGMSIHFSSYSICFGKVKVHIVNSSLFPIVGTSSIPFTSSLPLSSIFHEPNFLA